MKTYHIGFCKRGSTLVIQAVEDKDLLSCEIYDYMGERVITKKELHANRGMILDFAKSGKPAVYGNLKRAVVE
jgi:hypothetical protein